MQCQRVRLLALLLVAGLVAACSSGSAGGSRAQEAAGASRSAKPVASPDRTVTAVKRAYAGYRTAVLAKDGSSAVEFIAGSAFAFYDEARRAALTATDAELKERPVSERLAVYVMRGSLDATLLRQGTARELVAGGVNAGLVGSAAIAATTIGAVEVSGDDAFADVLRGGEKTSSQYFFRRERGTWKFDIIPLLEGVDSAFASIAEEQGKSLDEVIQDTLTNLYGPEKARQVHIPIGG